MKTTHLNYCSSSSRRRSISSRSSSRGSRRGSRRGSSSSSSNSCISSSHYLILMFIIKNQLFN